LGRAGRSAGARWDGARWRGPAAARGGEVRSERGELGTRWSMARRWCGWARRWSGLGLGVARVELGQVVAVVGVGLQVRCCGRAACAGRTASRRRCEWRNEEIDAWMRSGSSEMRSDADVDQRGTGRL
jgi:hypothetical protein